MRTLFSIAVVLGLAGALFAQSSAAEDPAAEDAAGEKHLLRYKFSQGEKIRWVTVHESAMTAKVKGHEQKSLSTSKSTKVWTVDSVAGGKISFVHAIEDVNMWRQVGDRAEERYNSKTDKKAPAGYENVALTIGKPITEATIDALGKILERQDATPKGNLNASDLVMPLPEKAIAIGEEWFAADEMRIPVQEGVKVVKTRKVFTLEKVSAGVATISVATQVLTPVNDPKVEAQLIQHVTKGFVKFDIDAGRVISRQLDWNDTVLGFDGPESSMSYIARFTEEILSSEPRTANKDGKDSK